MKLESRFENEVCVIAIDGRLDVTNAEQFKNLLNELLNSDANEFVFDLSKLDFVDSTGLGAIVYCYKLVAEKEGEIKISSLTAKPRMMFEITRAYRIFDIYDNVDTAISSFSN